MSYITRLERRPPGVRVSLVIGLLALVSVALVPSPARAQNTFPAGWVVDGAVLSMASSGNLVYAAGSFSRIGPRTGATSMVDLATGAPDLSWPVVFGGIQCAASDGHGGWFIAGPFNTIGSTFRLSLAHILADGTVDAWQPDMQGFVYTMAVSGSTLYVGGDIRRVNGVERVGLAAFDIETGLLTDWNPGVTGPSVFISGLAPIGSTLYFMGNFTAVGGQPRVRLGAADLASGAVTPWQPALPNGSVWCFAGIGSRVFLGGNFTGIAALAQPYLLAVDAVTGAPVAWNPAPTATVECMTADGDRLYVGGMFDRVGGQPHGGIARVDPITGAVDAWSPTINGTTLGIIRSGGTVYACGEFQSVAGRPQVGVVALDVVTGVASSWNPSPNGQVMAMGLEGSRLFLGGRFSSVGFVARQNLAAFDASTGAPTGWNPGANNSVEAVSVSGSTVYVGGSFTTAGGQPRAGLAAIDASTGLATSWNPSPNQYAATIHATPDAVYIGGGFTSVGGQARSGVAKLDVATGAVTDWNPGANGFVTLVREIGSRVYIGGEFTQAGGQPRVRAAAFDAATAAVTPWNPAPNATMNSLEAGPDGTLFTVGYFNSIGGQTRQGLAALDPVTGAATSWYPNNGGPQGLAVSGSRVYVAGNTNNSSGQSLGMISSYDALTGTRAAWRPQLDQDGQIICLATNGTRLYVGGWLLKVDYGVQEALLAYETVMDEIAPQVLVTAPNGGEEVFIGQPLEITWDASDEGGISSVVLRVSRNGPLGPWETIASGLPNTGHHTWTITGPASIVSAFIRVDATDGAGNTATDLSDAAFTITTLPVPTLLELFRAQATDDGVLVEWKTALPSTLLPQRGAGERGEWTAVNAAVEHAGDRSFVLDAEAPAGKATWYRLQGTLGDGSSFTSASIPVTRGAAVSAFALSPLAPNPFVNRALVSYALPVRAHIRISMVDIQGREVARLVDGEREPGRYTAQLDAPDLRAGIYYLRMEAPGVKLTQRAVLLH